MRVKLFFFFFFFFFSIHPNPAKFVRDEEERKAYEERERLKRSKSKTPRASKSTASSPVAPKRLSHFSPRPSIPSMDLAARSKSRESHSSSSDEDDSGLQSQITQEILQAREERSVKRMVEMRLGRSLPQFAELSETSYTVLLVQTGPQELLQVTLVEKDDGELSVGHIVEIATKKT